MDCFEYSVFYLFIFHYEVYNKRVIDIVISSKKRDSLSLLCTRLIRTATQANPASWINNPIISEDIMSSFLIAFKQCDNIQPSHESHHD